MAHAPANEATWPFTADSVLTTNPHVNGTRPYTTSELIGVAQVGSNAPVLAVNPKIVPAKTFAELVELSKETSLSFGSTPLGVHTLMGRAGQTSYAT